MSKKFDLDKITPGYFSEKTIGIVSNFFEKVAKKCPERANDAVDKYADYLQQNWIKRGKPEQDRTFFVALAYTNIGYFIDYFDGQTQDLMRKVFNKANHPVFGTNMGTQSKPMTYKQVKLATAKALRKNREKSK